MADPALSQFMLDAGSGAYAGSFDRDTLTWAFAKLAERTLDHLFGDVQARARYTRWILEEAPTLPASEPAQGLALAELDLDADGHLRIVARPHQGQFVFEVRHEQFDLVLACYYDALDARPSQECVCVAHFEGDPQLAARWAFALCQWFARQARGPGDSSRTVPGWGKATPAKC